MVEPRRSYETVPGFFLQDQAIDHWGVAIPPRFGLLDDASDRWPKLLQKVKTLNDEAPQGVSFKLIFASRHGEGYHNVAEAKYGTKAWNEYWAKVDSDGVLTWGPDPSLTEVGEGQARDANAIWKQELSAEIPLPTKLYCSPLTRALQTYEITFKGIVNFSETKPLILENCRERYGAHSCDMRRTLHYIKEKFPDFDIEDGFTENDQLHDPKVRETPDHVAVRARAVLDRIFDNDTEHVISITTHSGFINGIIDVTQHNSYPLPTGGVLPIVVKSTVA